MSAVYLIMLKTMVHFKLFQYPNQQSNKCWASSTLSLDGLFSPKTLASEVSFPPSADCMWGPAVRLCFQQSARAEAMPLLEIITALPTTDQTFYSHPIKCQHSSPLHFLLQRGLTAGDTATVTFTKVSANNAAQTLGDMHTTTQLTKTLLHTALSTPGWRAASICSLGRYSFVPTPNNS